MTPADKAEHDKRRAALEAARAELAAATADVDGWKATHRRGMRIPAAMLVRLSDARDTRTRLYTSWWNFSTSPMRSRNKEMAHA